MLHRNAPIDLQSRLSLVYVSFGCRRRRRTGLTAKSPVAPTSGKANERTNEPMVEVSSSAKRKRRRKKKTNSLPSSSSFAGVVAIVVVVGGKPCTGKVGRRRDIRHFLATRTTRRTRTSAVLRIPRGCSPFWCRSRNSWPCDCSCFSESTIRTAGSCCAM